MIVRMKRVDLLCMEQESDAALRRLRDFGVVHVCPGAATADEHFDRARGELGEMEKVIGAIPARQGAGPSGLGAEELVKRGSALLSERRQLEQERARLEGLEAALAPFGQFSSEDARELEESGIPVRLYRAGRGVKVKAPAGSVLCWLGEDRLARCFAVVGGHEPAAGWMGVPLPDRSLEALRAELRAVVDRLGEIGAELGAMAGDRPALERGLLGVREEVELLRVRLGMGGAGPMAHLRGYCPEDEVGRLRRVAREHGWGLAINEPGPDEPVPTLIRNPAWIRPFEGVMGAIGLVPGYREADMTPALLVFFSIFFAMIVGDAGYGLLYVALTLGLRRAFPRAPAGPFRLMWVLGVCTIIWGIMGGNYFGLRAPWHVGWLDSEEHLVFLCFLIGAVHLTLAHLWGAIRLFPSPQALAQVGWIISTWTMYFAAMTFILGDPFPRWMLWPFWVGLALILLFMTPLRQLRAEWHNHLVFPLAVVSNFGDVVSYVRLFAVGLAGYEVASNFNRTAWALGQTGLFGGIEAAVLLFLAHGMNIALSALGVVVHGVRLNALEFSSHLGVQWSGVRYTPFARWVAARGSHLDIAAGGGG